MTEWKFMINNRSWGTGTVVTVIPTRADDGEPAKPQKGEVLFINDDATLEGRVISYVPAEFVAKLKDGRELRMTPVRRGEMGYDSFEMPGYPKSVWRIA